MQRVILVGAAAAFWLGAQAAPMAQTIRPAPVDSTDPTDPTDPTAAAVDGEEIRGSDVRAMYDALPEEYQKYPLEMLYKQLLDQLIDQKLVMAAARKEGLLKDPTVQRRIAAMTTDLIHQIYMDRLIAANVTDRALRRAHANQSRSGGETEVRARHILVKTEAEAHAIIKEIQGGADFAKTAAKKSIGPTKRQGGDLGFFGFGQMVPPFSEVAFKLKPGEFTVRPVKTQFGWHIIKVEERRAAGTRSFAESVDELRKEMVDQLVKNTMAGLRAKADIKMMQGGNIRRVP